LKKKGAVGDRFIPKAVCANLYDLYFAENTESENTLDEKKDSAISKV
jgi:hypothetical protein